MIFFADLLADSHCITCGAVLNNDHIANVGKMVVRRREGGEGEGRGEMNEFKEPGMDRVTSVVFILGIALALINTVLMIAKGKP